MNNPSPSDQQPEMISGYVQTVNTFPPNQTTWSGAWNYCPCCGKPYATAGYTSTYPIFSGTYTYPSWGGTSGSYSVALGMQAALAAKQAATAASDPDPDQSPICGVDF